MGWSTYHVAMQEMLLDWYGFPAVASVLDRSLNVSVGHAHFLHFNSLVLRLRSAVSCD